MFKDSVPVEVLKSFDYLGKTHKKGATVYLTGEVAYQLTAKRFVKPIDGRAAEDNATPAPVAAPKGKAA